jgi:hypothetical protein
MPKAKETRDKIEVEPGAEKRLADILKKALNTPPQHRGAVPSKAERKGVRRGKP